MAGLPNLCQLPCQWHFLCSCRCEEGSSCLRVSLVLDPSPHTSSRKELKCHSWSVKCAPGQPAQLAPEPFVRPELPHIYHLSFPHPNSPGPSSSCPTRQLLLPASAFTHKVQLVPDTDGGITARPSPCKGLRRRSCTPCFWVLGTGEAAGSASLEHLLWIQVVTRQ